MNQELLTRGIICNTAGLLLNLANTLLGCTDIPEWIHYSLLGPTLILIGLGVYYMVRAKIKGASN